MSTRGVSNYCIGGRHIAARRVERIKISCFRRRNDYWKLQQSNTVYTRTCCDVWNPCWLYSTGRTLGGRSISERSLSNFFTRVIESETCNNAVPVITEPFGQSTMRYGETSRRTLVHTHDVYTVKRRPDKTFGTRPFKRMYKSPVPVMRSINLPFGRNESSSHTTRYVRVHVHGQRRRSDARTHTHTRTHVENDDVRIIITT